MIRSKWILPVAALAFGACGNPHSVELHSPLTGSKTLGQVSPTPTPTPTGSSIPSFRSSVQPILIQSCNSCHGTSFSDYNSLVSGNIDSVLSLAVNGSSMPLGGPPLSAA